MNGGLKLIPLECYLTFIIKAGSKKVKGYRGKARLCK